MIECRSTVAFRDELILFRDQIRYKINIINNTIYRRRRTSILHNYFKQISFKIILSKEFK